MAQKRKKSSRNVFHSNAPVKWQSWCGIELNKRMSYGHCIAVLLWQRHSCSSFDTPLDQACRCPGSNSRRWWCSCRNQLEMGFRKCPQRDTSDPSDIAAVDCNLKQKQSYSWRFWGNYVSNVCCTTKMECARGTWKVPENKIAGQTCTCVVGSVLDLHTEVRPMRAR